MKHIQFLGKYKEKLINGEKKITIRLTKGNFKVGDIFIAHSGGYAIGKFRITDIYTKKIKEITDEEAKLDGYNNKEELIRDLLKIYKNININKEICIIKFEPVEIFKEMILSEKFAWEGKDINIRDLAKKIYEYDDKLNEKEKKMIKLIIDSGSLRKAAMKLGNLNKRRYLRKILKKGYEHLKEKGII